MNLISGISTTGTSFKSDRVKLPVELLILELQKQEIYLNTSNRIRTYNGSTWSNL